MLALLAVVVVVVISIKLLLTDNMADASMIESASTAFVVLNLILDVPGISGSYSYACSNSSRDEMM